MKPTPTAALLAAMFVLPAAAGASPIGPILELEVTQDGIGPQADGCGAFRVTPQQARAFFDRAIVTTMRQQHDTFLWGSCTARGTLTTRLGPWDWEIRNLGTGSVQAVTGEVFLLADPTQESLLSDGDVPTR